MVKISCQNEKDIMEAIETMHIFLSVYEIQKHNRMHQNKIGIVHIEGNDG